MVIVIISKEEEDKGGGENVAVSLDLKYHVPKFFSIKI